MLINFFGCGGAFDAGVNSSGYIYKEGKLFIIDCGENTFSAIKKFVDKNIIKEVYIAITHTHADHVGGLSTLLHYLFYIKQVRTKIVCGSKIYSKIEALLAILGNEHKQFELYRLEDIKNYAEPSEKFRLWKGLEVYCMEVYHTPIMIGYSLIINLEGKAILFSGDSNKFVPDLLPGSKFDEIYHECYFGDKKQSWPHVHYSELEKFAENNKNINIYHYHNKEVYENGNFKSIQRILFEREEPMFK